MLNVDKPSTVVLASEHEQDSFVDSLSTSLADADWCELKTLPVERVLDAPDELGDMDCLVFSLAAAGSKERQDTLQAAIRAVSPTPVLVLARDAADAQSQMFSLGADDCLDPAKVPVSAMRRVILRSIERATQRVHVETARQQYRNLYNRMPVAACSVNGDAELVSANSEFLRLLAADQLAQVSDECMKGLIARLADELRDDSPSAAAEYKAAHELETVTGETRNVLVSAQAGRHTGEQPVMEVFLTDVTERDRLQDELQLHRKLESIGELAAGIAHEINTPAQYVSDNLSFLSEAFDDLTELMAILPTTVSALEAGAQTDAAKVLADGIEHADVEYVSEEVPAALAQAKDGIAKIREIVLALKEFSHPGGGSKESADLNHIIESTMTVARNEWKYVATIDLTLEESLPLVECHASAIGQAILNLLVNAAHAIADSRRDDDPLGQITIATRSTEHEVELVLSDNGPGIPDNIRHKVFDPFFTTKEVGKGTGQGLAICRSVIVDQHEGRIDLVSCPGEGTTFTIGLPHSVDRKSTDSEIAA